MDDYTKCDLVVSVDLGWSRTNTASTAISWCEVGEKPYYSKPGESPDLMRFLERLADRHPLVLIDIPIHGTEDLSRAKPYRTLDTILQRLQLPLLPSYKAGDYGAELFDVIKSRFPGFEVVESYPYAVLRCLWEFRDEPKCLTGPVKTIAKGPVFSAWPPKYKRERIKADRIDCMNSVLRLIGQFLHLDDYSELAPHVTMTGKQLNALCDVYDSLLGLIVGLEMVSGSSWFFPGRLDGEEAMIPLLLDTTLRTTWAGLTSESTTAGPAQGKSATGSNAPPLTLDPGPQTNIEIKARVTDFVKAGRIAASVAGGSPVVLNQVDTYFYASEGLLKFREDEHSCELIHYKRPAVKKPKRSDYTRLGLNSGSQVKDMLACALGTYAVVRKQRLVYLLDNTRIHLDSVETLGHFLEFEAIVTESVSLDECAKRVDELLETFSVAEDDLVEVSYCELIREVPW